MSTENTHKYQKKIITIPNLLSFFRLSLIPFIFRFYCVKKDYLGTTLLLLLSGATDVADGIIARKFDMVSDFGKAFDPIADKLTQIVTLFCLVTRFPRMLLPLVILSIKEVLAATLNMITIKKTGEVLGAVWHGKLCTVLLYSMILLHLLWYNLPTKVSGGMIFLCTVMMFVSSVLYSLRNIRQLKEYQQQHS